MSEFNNLPPLPTTNGPFLSFEEVHGTVSITSNSTSYPPLKPFYTSPSTTFPTIKKLDEVIEIIKKVLENHFLETNFACYDRRNNNSLDYGLDYEFNETRCEFMVFRLAIYEEICKFSLNIYTDTTDATDTNNSEKRLLIEGNRLCGESDVFCEIFNKVRSEFNINKKYEPLFTLSEPINTGYSEEANDASISLIRSLLDNENLNINYAYIVFRSIAHSLEKIRFPENEELDSKFLNKVVDYANCSYRDCDKLVILLLEKFSRKEDYSKILVKNQILLEKLLELCSSDGDYTTIKLKIVAAKMFHTILTFNYNSEEPLDIVNMLTGQKIKDFISNSFVIENKSFSSNLELLKTKLASCLE